MKKIINSMKPFIFEIFEDFMLIACLIVPFIMGSVFKFAIPILEKYLCLEFNAIQIIQPYYLIFDLLLAVMTPIMFTFAGVMTILSELDNGTAKNLCVTPIGKSGYLISRIGIPSVIAFFLDICALLIFKLTAMSFLMIICVAFSSSLLSLVTSMLVITLSKNKLEGMALIKLCGFLILGIPAVFFIVGNLQYIFFVLPSFWMTKLSLSKNYLFLIPTFVTSFVWIFLLANKFKRKFL